MVELAVICAGSIVLMVLLIWSGKTINYSVTPTHLRITWLGIPVRRIRLGDIRHISTKSVFWAEKWYNTLAPGSRLLAIHRRGGLFFKVVIITPERAFVFKNELECAQKDLVTAVPESPTPTAQTQKAA